MEQIARPAGLFALFRIIQYIPHIAIGLLVVMIVIWIIFGMYIFSHSLPSINWFDADAFATATNGFIQNLTIHGGKDRVIPS